MTIKWARGGRPRLVMLLGIVGLLGGGPAWADTPPACIKPGEWLRMDDGKSVAHDALLKQVSQHRVVLLGEHHTNADHHRWQLQVLAGLFALQPKMAIGFEMFPQEVQPVLDRWVAGELSEKEFLRQTHWQSGWRFDAGLYLPIFHFARINRIPMYAINVNPALLSEVRAKGWAAIDPAARQGITDPAPASRDYLKMLAGSFAAHRPPGARDPSGELKVEDKQAFQRFVEGQLLWDRAMAETLAAVAKRQPAPLVVGLMGTGHMVYNFGVPHQLAALDVADTVSLIPWDDQISCEEMVPGFADAVFGLAPDSAEPEPEKPRLGVFLEPSEGGVKVVKLIERSVAEASGVKEGDRIVEIAGHHVAEVDDVIAKVQAMLPGAWLPLTVLRGDQRKELVAKFPPRP